MLRRQCPDRWSSVIRGLGSRAAVISATRLWNQGLVLISPVILVRLLSVEDFGRYREFLLYTAVLLGFATFGISSSLLRFVPDRPDLKWRYVDQVALMTLASSVLVTGAALLADAVLGGKLMGEFAVPAVLYVLLFVNLDFWEFLWLAEKRSLALLGYTTGRLIARIAVVTVSAALTRNVAVIVTSLLWLEAARLLICAIYWRLQARTARSRGPAMWREQLEYCLPFGAALIFVTLNRSMGSLFVTKLLGPVALAHYAIGVYVQPVITVVRNSLSDVLLPEMVARNGEPTSSVDRLSLWRRTTVVTAIILVAAGVVMARFADVLVVTLFSEKYRAAVVIFQVYLVVFLRESVDFSVPLRAVNRTAPLLRGNVLALVINTGLLLVLLPLWGLLGAVAAFLISRFMEGIYLGSQMLRIYEVSLRALLPWNDLLKIIGAAGLAAVVLYGDFWMEHLGVAGIAAGGAAYGALFVALLALLRVPEVTVFFHRLRSVPAFWPRRSP